MSEVDPVHTLWHSIRMGKPCTQRTLTVIRSQCSAWTPTPVHSPNSKVHRFRPVLIPTLWPFTRMERFCSPLTQPQPVRSADLRLTAMERWRRLRPRFLILVLAPTESEQRNSDQGFPPHSA